MAELEQFIRRFVACHKRHATFHREAGAAEEALISNISTWQLTCLHSNIQCHH